MHWQQPRTQNNHNGLQGRTGAHPGQTKSQGGRRMKALRQSAVEPVFGILTQLAMRKIYTKGIHKANKQMLMAATAYNLKKLLK